MFITRYARPPVFYKPEPRADSFWYLSTTRTAPTSFYKPGNRRESPGAVRITRYARSPVFYKPGPRAHSFQDPFTRRTAPKRRLQCSTSPGSPGTAVARGLLQGTPITSVLQSVTGCPGAPGAIYNAQRPTGYITSPGNTEKRRLERFITRYANIGLFYKPAGVPSDPVCVLQRGIPTG